MESYRLLILVTAFGLCQALVSVSQSDELQECLDRFANDTSSFSKQEQLALCLKFFIGRNSKPAVLFSVGMKKPLSKSSEEYIQSLIDRFTAETRNPHHKRVRKEYRMLTKEERDNYHRAFVMLKEDFSVEPNKFEVISSIHASDLVRAAHGGPSFVVWHRIYMMIWEEALREKIPTVTLPYWDVTRGSAMKDPRRSIVWSPEFQGNGHGLVTTGPFADWDFMYGPLMRNYAVFSNLPTRENIKTVFTQKTLAEISQKTAKQQRFVFENYHNNIHNWAGGDLAHVPWAAFDPTFMLLHGYIDYTWYRFQDMQLKYRIPISSDYPSTTNYPILNGTEYDGDQPINIIPGMSIKEAVTEGVRYRDLIDYEDAPYNCDPETPCGSSNYECVNGFCASRSVDNDICNELAPLQNNFCVDTYCDIGTFFFLAVEVIHERLESLCNMGNFPVRHGLADKTMDIYRESASIIHKAKYHNRPSDMCGRPGGCCKPVERINIQIYGDDGNLWVYQESAYVDTRLAVSHSQMFMAVRRHAIIQFYIHASDEYGNLCDTYIVDSHGNKTLIEKGQSVTISGGDPRLSNTLAEAELKLFDYRRGPKLPPNVLRDQYVFSFYCRADRNV